MLKGNVNTCAHGTKVGAGQWRKLGLFGRFGVARPRCARSWLGKVVPETMDPR